MSSKQNKTGKHFMVPNYFQLKTKNFFKRPKSLLIVLFLFSCHNILLAQTGSIYLTWDNTVGCQVSSNPTRKSYAQLIESNEHLRVCGNTTVTYTVNTYDSTWISTDWFINGGIIGNHGIQTCEVKWNRGLVAVGSISGIIHTTNGDIIIQELGIDILLSPKVQFAKAPFDFFDLENIDKDRDIQACKNEPIPFINGSTPNDGSAIESYHWDFGDSLIDPTHATSSAENPIHAYNTEGQYLVALTVTNECGCQKTSTKYVTVGAKGINITCPGVVCEGQQSKYHITNPVEDCEYHWTIEGGSIIGSAALPDVLVNWTAPTDYHDGFGYITAIPVDCNGDCVAPTTLRIPVIKSKVPIKGPTTICGKNQQKYIMPEWPTTTFEWKIIQPGTTASIVYTDQRNEIIIETDGTADNITLEVVYQNTFLNCGGRSTCNIKIKADVKILGPKELCPGTTGNFTLADGSSANWIVRKAPAGVATTYTGATFTPSSSVFATTGDYAVSASTGVSCTSEILYVHVINNVKPLLEDLADPGKICPSTPSIFSMTNNIPDTVLGWSVPPAVGTIVGSNYGNQVQVVFNYPIPPTAHYSISVWRESTSAAACASLPLSVDLELIPFNMPLINGLYDVCGSTYQEYDVAETGGELYEWSILPVDAGSIVANGSRTVRVLWNQFTDPKSATLTVKVTKCNIPKIKDLLVTIRDPSITINVPSTPICQGATQTFSITPTPAITTGTITWDFGDGNIFTDTVGNASSVTHQYAAAADYTIKVKIDSPNLCHSIINALPVDITVLPLPVISISPPYVDACGVTEINIPITVELISGGPIISIQWYNGGTPITNSGTDPLVFTAIALGNYYAVVSNGTCTTSTDQVQIYGCMGCAEHPNMHLSLTRNCNTVVASGTYTMPSGEPNPLAEGYLSSTPIDSVTSTSATFIYPTPGIKVVNYVLTFADCQIKKLEHILIPYVVKLGVAVQCAAGNNYSVTLFDHSRYYNDIVLPTNTWVFKIDGVVQPKLTTDNDNNRTLLLTAGQSYVFELTIGTAATGYCTEQIHFDLRNVPNPHFDFQTPICQHTAENFIAVDQPNSTYFWSFDDDSYNYQQNAQREYSFGSFNPILTVTDQYGCSRADTNEIVVKINEQKGTISTPVISCPGQPNILNFVQDPQSEVDVTSVQWLFNNVPIPGAILEPDDGFTASTTGTYSVIVGNADGCTRQLPQSVPVAIMRDPFTAIEGPEYACLNQDFKLHVAPGGGSAYTYNWFRNDDGVTLSTTNEMTDRLTATGSHIYVLQVTFTLPDATTCIATIYHYITVEEPPVITDLYGTVEACRPYQVKLFAAAEPAGGVFNWSDGQSFNDGENGNLVYEDEGGFYEVSYTALGGCKVTGHINVDKSLENYMWIFPNGCYDICDILTESYLIGPDIDQYKDSYWFEMGNSVQHGHETSVDPHHLTSTSNKYNLKLVTENCSLVSNDMTVNAQECKDCKIEAAVTQLGTSNEPFFHYVIQIHFFNTGSYPLGVNITAANEVGIIAPGSVSVPPGGGSFTFSLIPDPLYTGNAATILLRSNQGKLCYNQLGVNFNDEGRTASVNHDNLQATLILSPNPAIDHLEVQFDYGSESWNSTAEILIYDLYGRSLEKTAPSSQQGVWKLDMGAYGAGSYIVVMKLNGKLLKQKILVLKD